MNYIGSKFSLLDFLDENIAKAVGKELEDLIFCDIFAGTGAVGAYFKNKVKKLISNDTQFYSYVLNTHYIKSDFKPEILTDIVSNLNNLVGIKGKIYQFYALGGGLDRQYFSDENACKIDAIREEISKLKLSDDIYFALLASLLESADKVANTASVYGAFLKKLKKSAQKQLKFELANFTPSVNKNEVYQMDANELMAQISGDILYLDPPYNHREYGANYHILNTIAIYDEFIPQGKTGLRKYEKSQWCKKNSAHIAFENLIKNANFKYIFLSYNNEGIISCDKVREIMQKYGKYELFTKDYKRFKADRNRVHKADKTIEFLHFLQKN